MAMPQEDKTVLRDLAGRLAEVAALPVQQARASEQPGAVVTVFVATFTRIRTASGPTDARARAWGC